MSPGSRVHAIGRGYYGQKVKMYFKSLRKSWSLLQCIFEKNLMHGEIVHEALYLKFIESGFRTLVNMPTK